LFVRISATRKKNNKKNLETRTFETDFPGKKMGRDAARFGFQKKVSKSFSLRLKNSKKTVFTRREDSAFIKDDMFIVALLTL